MPHCSRAERVQRPPGVRCLSTHDSSRPRACRMSAGGSGASALLCTPVAAAQTRDEPYGFARAPRHARRRTGRHVFVRATTRRSSTTPTTSATPCGSAAAAALRRVAHRVAAVSLVGEVRTENVDELELSALYVRWRPLDAHEFDIQAGRIPPVVGAFARRAYGRDNLVIGLPLAYQYLTSLRPDALPATRRRRAADARPRMAAQSSRSARRRSRPACRWSRRLAVGHRRRGAVAPRLDGAGRRRHARRAGGSGRARDQRRPAWSGRAAVHLPVGMTIGVSGARGPVDRDAVLALLPDDRRGASAQTLVGADRGVRPRTVARARRVAPLDVRAAAF